MARHLCKFLSVILSTVLVAGCFNSVVLADPDEFDENEQTEESEMLYDNELAAELTTELEQFDEPEQNTNVIDSVNITLEAPIVGTQVSMSGATDSYGLPVQTNGPVISGPDSVDLIGYWITGTVGPSPEKDPSNPGDIATPFSGTIERDTSYGVMIMVIPHDGYAFSDDAVFCINDFEIQNTYEATHGRYLGCSIKSVVRNPDPAPLFSGLSVTLDGQVGLNFLVDPNGVDLQGAYVSFEGNRIADQTNVSGVAKGDKIAYTVRIAPYQLADEITATLYYGDGNSVLLTKTSAYDYLNVLKSDSTYQLAEREVARSLLIYGYNSQVYLADYNGWRVGKAFAEIPKPDNSDFSDYQCNYVLTSTNMISIKPSDVIDRNSVATKLIIDSVVTFVVRFKLANGVSDSVTVTCDGEVQQDTDGYYYVYFRGIKGYSLGTLKTISVSDGNSVGTISASPMTYTHNILLNSNSSKAIKNLLCSLYGYCYACQTVYEEE